MFKEALWYFGIDSNRIIKEEALRKTCVGTLPEGDGLSAHALGKLLVIEEQRTLTKSFGEIIVPPFPDKIPDVLARADRKGYKEMSRSHFLPAATPVLSNLDGWLQSQIEDRRIKTPSANFPAWILLTSLFLDSDLTREQIVKEICPKVASDLGVQESLVMLPSATEDNLLKRLWPLESGELALEWFRDDFVDGEGKTHYLVGRDSVGKNGSRTIAFHDPDFKSKQIRFRVMIVFPQSR